MYLVPRHPTRLALGLSRARTLMPFRPGCRMVLARSVSLLLPQRKHLRPQCPAPVHTHALDQVRQPTRTRTLGRLSHACPLALLPVLTDRVGAGLSATASSPGSTVVLRPNEP